MQNVFSVLTGLAGSGKSSTLRIMVKMIEAAGGKLQARFPRASKEAGHIFLINGHLVGVVGAGDNEAQIRRRLTWLKEHGCNLALCASRPSKKMRTITAKLIAELFADQAQLHWTEKSRAATPGEIDQENELSARELLLPFRSIIP